MSTGVLLRLVGKPRHDGRGRLVDMLGEDGPRPFRRAGQCRAVLPPGNPGQPGPGHRPGRRPLPLS